MLKLPGNSIFAIIYIYIDESKNEPTIESVRSDGEDNPVLTRFRLERLGLYERILRLAGLLTTCYVRFPRSSLNEEHRGTTAP